MNQFNKEVGKRLRYYRALNGLSMTSVAEHVGVTYQQIQKYEVGDNRISLQMAWMFKQVFNISLEELLPEGSASYKSLADIGIEYNFRKHIQLHKHFDMLSMRHQGIVLQLVKDLAAE